MTKVALIGIVGVPSAYGGFETLAENIIGDDHSPLIEYTVFCSSKDCSDQIKEHKGAKLRYIALHANGIQSIAYDIIAMIQSMRNYDLVLILGVSGSIFVPIYKILSRSKIVINIDGMEHERDKWSKPVKWFLRLSRNIAIRFADVIIADNQGIIDKIDVKYRNKAVMIAYGGDHAVKELSNDKKNKILSEYGVERGSYSLALCRIEPENNCEMIVRAYIQSGEKLLFIGNWLNSDFGKNMIDKYTKYPNIKFINAIYDPDILYVLRSNCKFYVHGHSAGGTNPSLVEAMFCGCNILCYDVNYNRYTTHNKAHYFHNEEKLVELTQKGIEDNAEAMLVIAKKHYKWQTITKQYEATYQKKEN